MRERGTLLAAALLAAGCIPWPHHDRLAPSITGVVRSGAAPLGGVSIFLDTRSDGGECRTPDLVAKTDASGEFSVGPVEEFRWFAFVYGDPVARWTLCIDLPAGRRPLLRQGGIGRPPSRLDVQCDVSAPGVSTIRAFGTIEGNCSKRQ